MAQHRGGAIYLSLYANLTALRKADAVVAVANEVLSFAKTGPARLMDVRARLRGSRRWSVLRQNHVRFIQRT
jgi:hypothetical protein